MCLIKRSFSARVAESNDRDHPRQLARNDVADVQGVKRKEKKRYVVLGNELFFCVCVNRALRIYIYMYTYSVNGIIALGAFLAFERRAGKLG